MKDAPFFEDFCVGDDFSQVPAVTLTEGHAVLHQAMFGDRLRLPLDYPLAQKVTHKGVPVNPALVCNMAIGQTTIPSQRVMGNLFYRGLLLQSPVYLGDTLSTSTKVVALRQNRIKPGRANSGMVALEMHVTNQNSDTVMLFWRCPMIPCRQPDADTGHTDDFSFMPETLSQSDLVSAIPDWDLATFQQAVTGGSGHGLRVDQVIEVEARDTITLAPELVRMTLNLAMTHTDAGRSVYGKRLVYGGHTISLASAQLTRAIPQLVTVLGWYHCDHTAPVFEEDILQSRVTIKELRAYDNACIAILHIETYAERGPAAPESGTGIKVLDWKLAALLPPEGGQS